jgi:hypothetical protein
MSGLVLLILEVSKEALRKRTIQLSKVWYLMPDECSSKDNVPRALFLAIGRLECRRTDQKICNILTVQTTLHDRTDWSFRLVP